MTADLIQSSINLFKGKKTQNLIISLQKNGYQIERYKK